MKRYPSTKDLSLPKYPYTEDPIKQLEHESCYHPILGASLAPKSRQASRISDHSTLHLREQAWPLFCWETLSGLLRLPTNRSEVAVLEREACCHRARIFPRKCAGFDFLPEGQHVRRRVRGHKIPRSTRYIEYGLRSTRLAFTRIYPREINRNIVWSPHNESEYPILRCHGLAMRNGPRRPPHLPNLLQFSHIEIRISGAALAPKDICCMIHTKMN
jgi:hypothetical protein